ncbi:hypothetical protein EVAR_766_1 [Eumeta japonica]|uniref:Uncharacterized protein n=1 Tax=Eumeta variegata TaxID=151549 RepID=A0A4C1SEQ5_EUMVA|nr:hypothetical protein EVAR_766_1 [Eumeta japonica]
MSKGFCDGDGRRRQRRRARVPITAAGYVTRFNYFERGYERGGSPQPPSQPAGAPSPGPGVGAPGPLSPPHDAQHPPPHAQHPPPHHQDAAAPRPRPTRPIDKSRTAWRNCEFETTLRFG